MRGNQKNKNYKLNWDSNFAYAIGLIVTDGSLSRDKRHIILVSKDIEQIKNFKKCLNLDNKIGTRNSSYKEASRYYHVQFGNVKLYKELEDIGLSPNKTKTIGSLKIPDKYFFDFLRGHLDGDGCCYSFWDKRWKNSFMFYTVFASASLDHIKWLRSRIDNLLDIRGHVNRNRSLWQLKYAKKESRILIPNIYYQKRLPCLKRKYKKIKDILKIDKNSKGRVMKLVDIYA